MYIDIGNIKKTSEGGMIWYVSIPYNNIDTFRFMKFLYEIDCKNKIYKIKKYAGEKKSIPMSDFHSVPTESADVDHWEMIKTDEQKSMHKYVCENN